MSILADAIRPHWLAGLNEISGRTLKDIAGWICDENYQIYEPVSSSRFTLQVFEEEPMLTAYANEVSRIATAAFETMNLKRSVLDEQAVGWTFIETYYAAFFAAHALMRMMGLGCGPIGKSQSTSVLRVASSWNSAAPKSMRAGLYKLTFDRQTSAFTAEMLEGGPHEAFWQLFDSKIKEISDSLLAPKATIALDVLSRQAVALKLDSLRHNLSHAGSSKGTWLTRMRISINYDHRYSTWFPYTHKSRYYEGLKNSYHSWKDDPMDISLSDQETDDLVRLQSTCNFIVSLCLDVIRDMDARCSTGKSFHRAGALSFVDLSNGRKRVAPRAREPLSRTGELIG